MQEKGNGHCGQIHPLSINFRKAPQSLGSRKAEVCGYDRAISLFAHDEESSSGGSLIMKRKEVRDERTISH